MFSTGAPSSFQQPQQQTSNPFGTPTNNTPSTPFGGNLSTPFSTPSSTSFGNFGGPSTPSNTLFGTPTPSSTFGAQTPGSTFGTQTPASTFGTQTPASTFGTQTPASTFGTQTPSSFGGFPSTPAAPSSWGLSTTQQQQQPGSFFSQQQPVAKPPPNPIQDLQNLADATKTFFHFFYNVNESNTNANSNPAQIPGYQNDVFWNRAIADNPDPSRLIPVRVCGFKGLDDRIKEQKKAIRESEQILQVAKEKFDELERNLESQTKDRIEEYKRVNVQLSQKTLGIMTKLEVLRSKGYPIHADEDAFRGKLENLQRELSQPTQFKGRLNELNSLVRMQEDLSPQVSQPLEDDDLSNLFKYLSQQTEGVKLLVDVIKNDSQDLDVMLKEYQNESS